MKAFNSAVLFVLMLFITANQFWLLAQIVGIQMNRMAKYRYNGVCMCVCVYVYVQKFCSNGWTLYTRICVHLVCKQPVKPAIASKGK